MHINIVEANKNMRYMKSLFYSLLPMLMVLGLASCQQDRGALGEPDNVAEAPVRVVLKNSLRATGSDALITPTTALDREKKVTKLYAVVYHANGSFFNVIECTPEAGSTEVYTFDMKAEGAFQFHLVANPSAELLEDLKTKSNVIGDIDRIVVKQTAGEDNKADNFVLTSDRIEVTTVRNSEATTTPNVVKLERLSARFDFLNRVPKLNITKITFNKRMTESYLFARTDVSALASTTDKSYTTAEGMQARQCVASIYGYENPVSNDTYFTIEGTFNGKEIKPYEIRLNNLTVKRNHLYTIAINPIAGADVEPGDPSDGHVAGKLPITFRVLDWEEGETLSKDDAELLAATYVEHSATVGNAHFMDPFLTQSPSEVYTVTKSATTVELKVGTYINPGELVFDGTAPTGVKLEKKGSAVKEADGKFVQTYTLTLPEQDKFADVAQYYMMSKQGRTAEAAALPNFLDVKLIAKGPFGDDIETFVVRHGRMKTPLEHLSEYAIKHSEDNYGFPTGFYEGHDIFDKTECYFQPITLSKFFANAGHKWVAPDKVTYHMPLDNNEWRSIFPGNQEIVGPGAIDLGHRYTHNVEGVAIHPRMRFFNTGNGVGPVPFLNRSDYGNSADGKIGYALKFKATAPDPNKTWAVPTDGSLLVAYRYEYVGTFGQVGNVKDVEDGTGKAADPTCHLKVTARYLSKGWKGSIYDISKEEFWAQDNSQDVVRLFPFAGSYWLKSPASPDSLGSPSTWGETFKKYEGVYGHYPCYTDKRDISKYYWNRSLYLRISDVAAASGVLCQKEGIMYPYRLFTDEL